MYTCDDFGIEKWPAALRPLLGRKKSEWDRPIPMFGLWKMVDGKTATKRGGLMDIYTIAKARKAQISALQAEIGRLKKMTGMHHAVTLDLAFRFYRARAQAWKKAAVAWKFELIGQILASGGKIEDDEMLVHNKHGELIKITDIPLPTE
jgi:hypothetical protein